MGDWVTVFKHKSLTNEEELGRKKRGREALKEEKKKENVLEKMED